jgi:hypothetical protein
MEKVSTGLYKEILQVENRITLKSIWEGIEVNLRTKKRLLGDVDKCDAEIARLRGKLTEISEIDTSPKVAELQIKVENIINPIAEPVEDSISASPHL